MSRRIEEKSVVASKAKPKAARPTPKRFYARALSEAERADLPVALEVEGMEEELAVLRLRLRSAIEAHPEDLPLMFRGIELIARAVAARYRLPKGAQGDLTQHLVAALDKVEEMLPGAFAHE
jgi:hypothetical protein